MTPADLLRQKYRPFWGLFKIAPALTLFLCASEGTGPYRRSPRDRPRDEDPEARVEATAKAIQQACSMQAFESKKQRFRNKLVDKTPR